MNKSVKVLLHYWLEDITDKEVRTLKKSSQYGNVFLPRVVLLQSQESILTPFLESSFFLVVVLLKSLGHEEFA